MNCKPDSFRDSGLRPIHDPGDDARDQTLDWRASMKDDPFKPGARAFFVMHVKDGPLTPAKTYDWPADVIAVHGDRVIVRYDWRGAEVMTVFHRRQLRIG